MALLIGGGHYVLGLLLVILSLVYWRFSDRHLSKIPGPRIARLTQLWRVFDVWRSRCDLTELALHQRYGPYVRVGPNLVSIADPTLISYIYSAKLPLPKSSFYYVADAAGRGGRFSSSFSLRDECLHAASTRPIQASFNMSRLIQFEPRVDTALDYLVDLLKKQSKLPQPCNITGLLRHFAWDVAGEMNFSKRFGAMDEDPRAIKLISEVVSAMGHLSIVGQIPRLDLVLRNQIYPLVATGFDYAINTAVASLADRVKTRNYPEQRDFIDLFIDAEKNTDAGGAGEQFTPRQITWLSSNILAGSDSTGAAIQSAVYYVARDPVIRARLVAELTAAFPSGKVTWKVCNTLPYLEAVCKETFRVEPGVGMLLERIVPAAGLTLPNGMYLPPATVIGMNARVLNHDKTLYGDDASEFKPSRWLRGSDEPASHYQARLNVMRKADLTFGCGPRACYGKPIAMLEVFKCIARLFLEFDIALADPSKDMGRTNRWFMIMSGIEVVLRDRKTDPVLEKEDMVYI